MTHNDTCKNMLIQTINLFVTLKNETTNSPIHEFKLLHKGQITQTVYYFLFLTLKKHFKPCFFILKTFCSTLVN